MSAVAASKVVAEVEKDLRAIWSDPTSPGDVPKTRVCAVNLVVVGPKDLADRYTAIVDEVTANVPARAIVVALDPTGPDGLRADTTAVCTKAEGGAAVLCSERVRFFAGGEVCGRAGSAVEALLVPEIETVLVWLGEIETAGSTKAFTEFAENADRLVLDTEYTSFADLARAARWAAAAPSRPAICDLAWTRLGPWQELVARFFDTHELTPFTRGVTSVTLEQASDPGAPLGSEVALFLGWLGSALGWKIIPATGTGDTGSLVQNDRTPIALMVKAVERPRVVAPLALAGFALEAAHGGKALSGSVARELASGSMWPGATADADVLVWKLDVDMPTATEQRVRMSANKGARLLDRTLHRPARDPLLEEAIAFADAFLTRTNVRAT
ncbi:MAG: glucose-6-phosphate dehydrogenase assembly protein OpcA [Polyangiaceae bacterium]